MVRSKGRRDVGLELFDNSSGKEEPSPSKQSKKRKTPATTNKAKKGKGEVAKKGKVADVEQVRSPMKAGKRKRDEEESDLESDEEDAPEDPESETGAEEDKSPKKKGREKNKKAVVNEALANPAKFKKGINYRYYTGETYTKRINICSRTAYIREVSYKLPIVGWDNILEGPLGIVIRMMQHVAFFAQTMHDVLMKQLESPPPPPQPQQSRFGGSLSPKILDFVSNTGNPDPILPRSLQFISESD